MANVSLVSIKSSDALFRILVPRFVGFYNAGIDYTPIALFGAKNDHPHGAIATLARHQQLYLLSYVYSKSLGTFLPT